MQDRFATIARGRVHYLHAGSGPALVLLHSNGGSAYDFEAVTERLAASFELFVWDMPGQGDSGPLSQHLDVRDYASDVVEFMDAVGLARASVAGVSIGGAICVALGAHHSDRIDQLVIVESPFRTPAEWAAHWPRIEANFGQPVQSRAAVEPRFNSIDDAFITRWNIDRSKAGAKTMMGVMWALREYDTAADLQACPSGSMVVLGDKGPTIAAAENFRSAMQQPVVEIMQGSGHFPMIDDPEGFCALLERHCAPRS